MRGKFILFEGLDRSGKSTQAKLLAERLQEAGHETKHYLFPNRTTEIGQMIDRYLSQAEKKSPEVIHLLFCANRWEVREEMVQTLESGVNIVCDRYSFSGVSYSVGANGLDFEWCKGPEKQLIEPDVVFFLRLSPEEVAKRKGFGDEIYEKHEIQHRVRQVYENQFGGLSFWDTVECDGKDIEKLQKELFNKSLDLLQKKEDAPAGKLFA